MLGKLFAKVVCCVLVVVVPTAAADTGAVMNSTAASINGKAATQTATVFAGDQIAVNENGRAVIQLGGSTITLPAASAVRYGGLQIELNAGAVVVSTRKGMGVKLGNVSIVPATQNARYQVSTSKGAETIMALEGALTVSNGVQSYTLAPGKQMSRNLRAASPQTGAEDFGLPGWAVVGIIAAGIAITTGVIVATQDDDSVVAP